MGEKIKFMNVFLVFFFFLMSVIIIFDTEQARGMPAETDKVKAMIEEGVRQYQNENYEEAVEILTEVRRRNPSSSTAAFFLGLCYKQTNEPQQAIPQFTDAATLKPAVKEAVVELIDALIQVERIAEAENWVAVAEKNDIYPAKVAFLKGMILSRKGKFSEAITSFDKAKSLDKNYAQAADFQIGIALMGDRKFSKARERFQAAVTQDPLSDLGAFARRYQDIVEEQSFLQRPVRLTLTALGQYDTNMLQEPFLYYPDTSPQVQSSNNYVNESNQKSFGLMSTARADFIPILPGNWLFNAGFTALSNVHEKNSTTYDIYANSFSAAPGYNFGAFALNLNANYTFVAKRGDYENNGGGYRRYSENFTVGPLLRFLPTANQIVELSGAYAKNNNFKTVANPELNDMSGTGLDSYVSWMWLFAPAGILNLKFGYTINNTDGIFYDNQGYRLTANLIYPLWNRLKLQISGDAYFQNYRYENTNYSNTKRKDQIYTGTIGLTWDLNRYLSLLLQYAGTRANSNIYAYDYDRSLYSAGCELRF